MRCASRARSATTCKARSRSCARRSPTSRCSTVTSATDARTPLALPERITSFPVVLRLFTPGDATRVVELCGDPAVALTTATIPHPYPHEAATAWIGSHGDAREAGIAWTYAITRTEDDMLVGAIDVRTSAEPELALGYWIGRT